MCLPITDNRRSMGDITTSMPMLVDLRQRSLTTRQPVFQQRSTKVSPRRRMDAFWRPRRKIALARRHRWILLDDVMQPSSVNAQRAGARAPVSISPDDDGGAGSTCDGVWVPNQRNVLYSALLRPFHWLYRTLASVAIKRITGDASARDRSSSATNLAMPTEAKLCDQSIPL